jgi:hypothetical protein
MRYPSRMAGSADSLGWQPETAGSQLAWELAEIAKRHLGPNQRNAVYIAIGVGDVFWAATFLLQTVVRCGVGVRAELMLKLTRWVASYRDHPDELHLRNLIGRLRVEPFTALCHEPATATASSAAMRDRQPTQRTPRLRTLRAKPPRVQAGCSAVPRNHD